MSNLTLTTFNIRCFGFNGNYHAVNRMEYRIQFLKSFIEKYFSDTDVFIFQEIMDLSILNQILPDGFKFYHYTHDYPRHMYVVLACRKEFDFSDVQIIPNTALDDTKSRYAFYGKLIQDQKDIAHIIGVHLKSGYEHTEKRIFQCQLIYDFINSLSTNLPVVLAGDFNSHFKTRTGKDEDDLSYFKTIFKDQMTLTEHNKKTYILPMEETHLDHFWIRNAQVQKLEVYDFEHYSENNALKKYYSEISDHLPVKIKLKL